MYNNDLLKHVDLFRKLYLDNLTKQPNLVFRYYYASKGDEIHGNVSRKVNSLEVLVKSLFSSASFNFEFVTAEKLLSLSRKKQKVSHTLKLKESPISTEDGGYICLANLHDYFNFVTDDEKTIQKYMFDANVRDYQGAIVVNKEINNTLVNDKDYEFWWFNNGITILTEKASVSSKIMALTSPQIVNGCQTSFEIYSYFKKHSVSNDNRSLTIRIIVTNDEKVKSKVVKSTNSQTSIPPAVLSATDPMHRNIEEYFRHNGLYYDRRKNFWKNENKPIKDIVPIALLAQTFKAMILQEPHISRGKPSSFVKNDADYNSIFNPSYNLEGYFKIISLQRRIEKLIKETKYLGKGDGLNIRYFVYLHVVLSNRLTKKKTVSDVPSYIEDLLESRFDILTDDSINDSIKTVYNIYSDHGKTDGTAKAKYFTDSVIESAMEEKPTQELQG